MPSAIPPWGGAPDRSASSRKPNFSFASSAPMPSVRNTLVWTSGSCNRMEPAAELEAVEHEIVAVAVDPRRVGLEERQVLVVRAG